MKVVLKLLNLVYIVLAAIACVALFTKPLVAINASLSIPKEQVSGLIYDSVKDQISEEDFNKALDKSMDENGRLTLTLKLEVPPTSVITKDSKAITSDLTEQVNDTVTQIVDKLEPAIKEIAKAVAKKEGAQAIKDSIADQIKGTNPDGDAAQIMADAGITDEYINDMTDEVFTLLLGDENGEGAVKTVDELMTGISNNIEDVCGKLADAGVPGYPSDPEELHNKVEAMSADIETQLQKALQDASLCDEDGNITDINEAIDSLLVNLLDQLLGGGSSESSEPAEEKGEPDEVPEKKMIIMAEEGTEEEESKLKQKIREILTEKIEEFNINGIVEQHSFVPLIFTGLLVLPWAIFIIITIIRTIRRKKYWTKSWVVFSFAAVQVVLGIALYLATAKFTGQLLNIIPLPDNPAIEIIKNSSLAVQTSAFIPSILYLAMIPLTIVYMILAHKAKKDYKESKKA